MMKRMILVAAVVLGIAAIASAVLLTSQRLPDVKIAMSPAGLKSLKVDDAELLQNGDFKVEEVTLKRTNGDKYPGGTYGTPRIDPEHKGMTKTYPWGTVKTEYAVARNRLTLTITTSNTSATDTIQGIRLVPLHLKFPHAVKEYDGSTPLLFHNLGQVAAMTVSYGSGVVSVVAEDMDKPLIVGFPWALNRPTNTEFPLDVHTDRVSSFPDSLPAINRPIPPKGSDQYVVSLRFGHSNTPQTKLNADVYKRFADAFPQQLKWNDHRPIGTIFLATSGQNWPSNPRGWFGDASLNTTTPAGVSDFRQHLLMLADNAIQIMQEMNAQGAITWDPEGQEFARMVSYAGDPRKIEDLAPEMRGVIDEYFQRFRQAGLRAGICVRPQDLQISGDRKSAAQASVGDPADLLIQKIAYAKKRWGVTLIYIDSNTNATDPNPLDASIIQKVAAAFPDSLLIPEHSNLRYYAYSVPYKELRQGIVSTADLVRQTYPNAFSVIYTADGPLDLYRDNLTASVKHGDTFMYRTWFADPQNEKVKALFPR